MGTRQRKSVLRGVAVVALALLIAPGVLVRPARANGDVAIFDQAPNGVTVNVWASAEMAPLAESTGLWFERTSLDACSAIALDGSEAGPVLVLAESYTVTVTTGDGRAATATTLTQGESTVVPAGQPFRLSNGMVDPAFRAIALTLYPAVDRTESMGWTKPAIGEPFAEWETGSSCEDIGGETTTTLIVLGLGLKGANRLYVGSAMWDAGATTEGYAVTDGSSAFNLVLLSGGMGNAGLGTGRGFHNGPYHSVFDVNQTIVDASPGEGAVSSPFANLGQSPVYGLIFGTATGDTPIYAETR